MLCVVNEYCVKTASAYFHEFPSSGSAVTDELLYGTRIFAVSPEKETENWLCAETMYGYRGFVRKKDVRRKTGLQLGKSFTVTSPFCDILPKPEYKYKPLLTIPRGSKVVKNSSYSDVCGFTDIDFGGKVCYVRNSEIKPEEFAEDVTNPDDVRKNIVDTALLYLGTPYRWAGKSPSGIDCSGLCFQSYAMNGLGLWRDAVPDSKYVKQISFSELKEADLVYFKGHVVMYIGGGEYIHSSATLGGVVISSFDKNSAVYYKKLDGGIIMCARSVKLP